MKLQMRSSDYQMQQARVALDCMTKVSVSVDEQKKVSFQTAYTSVLNLTLHKHAPLVTTILKLIARVVVHLPEKRRQLVAIIIKAICIYYENVYVASRSLPTCLEVIDRAREELVAWAMGVFSRRNLHALLVAWYFRPGGAYERRIAAKPRWIQTKRRQDEELNVSAIKHTKLE